MSILEIVKSPHERIMGYVVIWVIFGSDDAMTGSRPDLRLPAIVLAAMLGMFSVAGEASGCSANGLGDGKAARSCCSGRPRSACCCEVQESTPRPRPIERTAIGMPTVGGPLVTPVSSCECREDEPTEPASKPARSSPRHRLDQDGAPSFDRSLDVRPALALARLVDATESPPGAPLYLRTSHMRF